MASIYGRLDFDFTPPNTDILLLSTEASEHLNSCPRFMTDWQKEDVANSDVDGYFKNPVANSINKIIANTTIIYGMANTDPANTWTNVNAAMDLANAAGSLLVELNLMLSHTNNVSGVNDVATGGDAVNDFPYQETASGVGRFMVYLTHESDGVLNSSPIIGSMTCLFIETNIEANNTIVYNDRLTINSSNVMGIITLSNSAINSIITDLQSANTYLAGRKNHDIQFYRNSRSVLSDYSAVSKFSNMGETNTKLCLNYIGSDKLTSRLANT